MRRRAAAGLVIAVLVAGAAPAGCGEEDEPAAQATATTASEVVELTVVYDDGSGRKTTGALTCRGANRSATGALEAGGASPAELCEQALGNAELLTKKPDEGRQCTQVYGGPETAVVTGTIGGERVNRRFTRTNGCEIADYTRAAGLLQP
jgi:hypothetical protein